MKKIWYSIKDYVYIVLIVVLIRTFLVTPAAVSGSSMESTLNNHDLVISIRCLFWHLHANWGWLLVLDVKLRFNPQWINH